MTRNQIRIELLRQHTDLRREISELRALAKLWSSGGSTRNEVHRALLRFVRSLGDHNHREEELLDGILSTVDDLGPSRATIMSERHVEEHHELHGALIVAGESPSADAAVPLLEFLFTRVLDHMAHEEDAFLGGDVLGGDEAASASHTPSA